MLSDLFTYAETEPITAHEERELIASAQAGDDLAHMRLLNLYGPLLRATVARASKTMDAEDAQSVALLAFEETLATHIGQVEEGFDGRLGGRLAPAVRQALGVARASDTAFAVPARTLTRYLGILNSAEGDPVAASEMAPEFGMSTETWIAIHHATRADSLDGAVGTRPEAYSSNGGGFAEGDGWSRDSSARPIYDDGREPIADAEDAILVRLAFKAVDDEEARIVEMAYGFTEYDTVPDAEIGHRLGLTRPTVQRRRAFALSKMRKALGVTSI